MTDNDKALVERLRDFVIAEDIDLAADRIEALSAENERLTQRYNELGNAAMKQVAELGAKVGRLEAENERLREALRTVEQGVPRPVGKSWFPDGRPSKHDQCIHGIWMYEPCEGCTDTFIAAALGETK